VGLDVFVKNTMILTISLLLISCGSDDTSDGQTGVTAKVAYFVDSGVRGLEYNSNSYQGITDTNGGFEFETGEVTIFSFKGLQLGSITTTNETNLITPFDLFDTTDIDNQSVINTLVFLQSLDNDRNPRNGISLPEYIDTLPDSSSLDISSVNFQTLILPALYAAGLGSIDLVSESDSQAHFNNTLLNASATPNLVGRWITRTTTDGDINGTYIFNADLTFNGFEIDECANNGNFWVASESSGTRNCTFENITGNWLLNDTLLTLNGQVGSNNISDTCSIISSSTNFIEANCVYQGSSLGSELIRFERDITELTNSLITNTYREVSAGDSSFTQLTFNADLTGSYVYYKSDGLAQAGAGDRGDFTWATSDSQIMVTGTDNSDEAFTNTWTVDNNIRGAFVVANSNSDGENAAGALIPDFDASLAEVLFDQAVFGVYGAVSGECKSIYIVNSQILRKDASVGVTTDICDYSSPIILPDSQDEVVFSISYANGSLIIEQGNEREICWPIAYNSLSTHVGFSYLACATEGSSTFDLKILRGL
jgi:hypothetical protein